MIRFANTHRGFGNRRYAQPRVAGDSNPPNRSNLPLDNDMDLTNVKITICNPNDPQHEESHEFLVDSGAIYSVVPGTLLKRLGLKPYADEEFHLADGTTTVRKKGYAMFKYLDRIGVADVVFGERGDASLLGAFTLEALGLALDPLKRQLRPLPMVL